MPNQEDIQEELDQTVRAARVAQEGFKAMFTAKLETAWPLNNYEMAAFLSSQAENTLADWIVEAMDFGRSTPEEALREVRGKATNAIFKGERTDDPLLKAMDAHRKNTYTLFLQLTQHMLGDEAPRERRSSNQYTLENVTDQVRRHYESAVRGNHSVLIAAYGETLFTLTTGYQRHQAEAGKFETFAEDLYAETVLKYNMGGL